MAFSFQDVNGPRMDAGVVRTMGQELSEIRAGSPPSRKGCLGTVD